MDVSFLALGLTVAQGAKVGSKQEFSTFRKHSDWMAIKRLKLGLLKEISTLCAN